VVRTPVLPSNPSQPIGVFDSGVGGLTVLNALRRKMPHTDFLYVADTARVPYGRKPPAMVREFASQILHFLLDHQVSSVVVACNTACSVALPALADLSPVPVFGVIEPSVEAAAAAARGGAIGVIGTKATIASLSYQSRLEARGLTTWARACPMLVHIVEEGLVDSPETSLLLRHYLDGRPPLDALVLGCTHYPFLSQAIQRVVGDSVTLVSCAETVSDLVAARFAALDCDGRAGSIVHYTTGDPAAYRHTSDLIGTGTEGEIRALDVTLLAGYGASAFTEPPPPATAASPLRGSPSPSNSR